MTSNAIQSIDVLRIQLAELGEISMPAIGISMGKNWSEAIAVIVCDPLRRSPGWGDVVVYQTKAGWVAHRLVRSLRRSSTQRWITKGDGYWRPDRMAVKEQEMLGLVIGYIDRTGQRVTCVGRWPYWRGLMHSVVGYVGSWLWRPL